VLTVGGHPSPLLRKSEPPTPTVQEARRVRHRRRLAEPDPAPKRLSAREERAADARYNRAVAPLLLKRASLPVFLGRSAGRFLAPDGADEWDCVALVRYRSKRDLLGMCAELARSRADIHKWASIERTHVFPVRVPFSLIAIRLVVGCLFAVLGVLTCLGLRFLMILK
jgi:hypothetical protein